MVSSELLLQVSYFSLHEKFCLIFLMILFIIRCGNVAAILALDENLEKDFKLFRETPDPCSNDEAQRRANVPYFL